MQFGRIYRIVRVQTVAGLSDRTYVGLFADLPTELLHGGQTVEADHDVVLVAEVDRDAERKRVMVRVADEDGEHLQTRWFHLSTAVAQATLQRTLTVDRISARFAFVVGLTA